MLYTNLKHIESAAVFAQAIKNYQNAIIICGRMDYQSILVYRFAEELKNKYKNVAFFDMEIDNPETSFIQNEIDTNKEIPLVLYYKNQKIVKKIFGIQSKEEMTALLNNYFSASFIA